MTLAQEIDSSDSRAPWLQESLHLLLDKGNGDWLAKPAPEQNAKMPLWLAEGLPDALAIEISAKEGLRYYSPLWSVGPDGLDAQCRTQASTAEGGKALAFVGALGKMPELFGPDRVTTRGRSTRAPHRSSGS